MAEAQPESGVFDDPQTRATSRTPDPDSSSPMRDSLSPVGCRGMVEPRSGLGSDAPMISISSDSEDRKERNRDGRD